MSKTPEMKVTFGTKSLVRAIGVVERAVGKRDVMQVLKGIMIDATGPGAQLVATDLELGIKCGVENPKIETPGKVVIDAKLLSPIVRKVEAWNDIVLTKKEDSVTLTSGTARFNIQAMPADDFPELPGIGEGIAWNMRQSDLKQMIRETIHAAARDESRPALTGLLMEIKGGKLIMVATDTGRLAYRTLHIGGEEEMDQIIVPLRTMQELYRLLSDNPDHGLGLTVSDKQVAIQLEGVTLTSRLIDGLYPDYHRALPKPDGELAADGNIMRVEVPRHALFNAVERAALVYRGTSPLVLLSGTEDAGVHKLRVTASEPGLAASVEEIEHVQITGPKTKAHFQVHYLSDALRALGGAGADNVVLCMRDGTSMASIRGVESDWDKDNQDYKREVRDDFAYVMMPIRVGV